MSAYKQVFGPGNHLWSSDEAVNHVMLLSIQNHMNNLMRVQGHVFLNEVHDALGLPRTREGALVGWMFDSSGSDNFVDITQSPNPDGSIELDFNVDGTIYNLL